MMQARTAAIGKGDVVHAALAVHPGGPEPAGLLVFGVFGDAEAHLAIEGCRLVDVRREEVEMVDAERLRAAVETVLLMHWRQAVHAREELQRCIERVRCRERPSLPFPLDPRGGSGRCSGSA